MIKLAIGWVAVEVTDYGKLHSGRWAPTAEWAIRRCLRVPEGSDQ